MTEYERTPTRLPASAPGSSAPRAALYTMSGCWNRPMSTAGRSASGFPCAFASRKVTIASSETSNSRSRTVRLNPALTGLTSAQSSATSGERTAPDLSAAVTG